MNIAADYTNPKHAYELIKLEAQRGESEGGQTGALGQP